MRSIIFSLTKKLIQIEFFRCIDELKNPIFPTQELIHRFSNDSLDHGYFHHSLVPYLWEFDCKSERRLSD
jgi:hypothetical protein